MISRGKKLIFLTYSDFTFTKNNWKQNGKWVKHLLFLSKLDLGLALDVSGSGWLDPCGHEATVRPGSLGN